ncbi:MAG: immune inhibitor A domain-containing protein [Actinomycetota bacterium]
MLKRPRPNARARARLALAGAALTVLAATLMPASAAADRVIRVGGYEFLEAGPGIDCILGQILFGGPASFAANECATVDFIVDGGGPTNEGDAPALNPAPQLEVRFTDQTGKLVHTQDVSADPWSFTIDPATWETDWAPGTFGFEIVSKVKTDVLTGQPKFQFTLNQLGTRTILERPSFDVAPGGLAAEPLVVTGATWMKDTKVAGPAGPTDPIPLNTDLVPGDVSVELTRKDGSKIAKTATASLEGIFSVTFSPAEIGNVASGAADNFETPIRVRTTGTYTHPVTGDWATGVSDTEREAVAVFTSKPDRAQVRAQFVSERGWVAPGEEYIHEIEYRNISGSAATGATITETLPANAVFVSSTPAPTSRSGNMITWKIGSIASGLDWPAGAKAANRILVTARAKTFKENPQIVHHDLSATAVLTQSGKSALSSTTHGPRVTTQETARFGDRPFPVVLVDYVDFKHSPAAAGWTFYNRISNPNNPASIYTHYQNMSFGQLYPQGELAALNAKTTAFTEDTYKWSNPYFKGNTCTGVTTIPPDALGQGPYTEFTPATERIVDGWYQLPGQRQYYGADDKGTAIALGSIDAGCGPTSKMAYDAASIADPEIDYNEFDSDRNCLVDFFEIAFQGRGGNGDSQLNGGYDNVWPHSGDLTDSYIDPVTGISGYESNDQCRDRLERPLWWTDQFRLEQTTKDMGDELRAFSRVGPYNVNPENGTTSVFAHEYGHSLGLPDFYSGDRDTIEYWDLMATDGFQYMSVFSRQDLGWIVPRRTTTSLNATLRESKIDTHRIDAIDANGDPYTLSGPNVHNADAFYVELPHRTLFESVPSGKHAFYSTAGDGFGCPGRTMDIDLENTRTAPAGTALTLSFKSWYEIEWDFDYGFVMISTDKGKTFQSVASEEGRTTPREFNPFTSACQEKYSNGITGSSASPPWPQNVVARTNGDMPAPEFIDDSYDISACAGTECVIRLAYSTDVGVAMKGWVVDDLKVAGDDGKTYFDDDGESQRPYLFDGWTRFATGPTAFDHGYYVELRDRVGNDFDSAGQGDRHPINWIPGISIWYTDEAHGYGNNGVADPPAQTVMDPRSQAANNTPNLRDASFFPLPGLNRFSDKAWTDNYAAAEGGPWRFAYDCFGVSVGSISGLGKLGTAKATISLSSSPKNCVKVLSASQGKPKPVSAPKPAPAGKPLPATGVPSAPVWIGVLSLCGALAVRRWAVRTARTG